MVPFRMKQMIMADLRHRPDQRSKPQPVHSSPSEAIRVLCWNASQGLQLEEWVTWCSSQPFELILVQETGWTLNRRWTAHGWYMIHSYASRASTLCMVRSFLLRSDQLTVADLIPGRLQHIRLHLTRIHDVLNFYQFAWNTTKPRATLIQDRAKVCKTRDAIQHVPKSHMLLPASDCNTPVTAAPPAIGSHDAKFGQAAQTDRHEFQALVQELNLCAPHSMGKWTPTFVHGTHSTRIDFTFLRSHQTQWNKHDA